MKIVKQSDAKAVWDALPRATATLVREKLIADGYAAPTARAIQKWAKKGGWQKKPRPPRETEKRRVDTVVMRAEKLNKTALDSLAVVMTGNPEAKQEDLSKIVTGKDQDGTSAEPTTDAGAEAKTYIQKGNVLWEQATTDELKLDAVSMQAMETAHKLFRALGAFADHLVLISPEVTGNAFRAISAGLVTALSPLDRIAAAREIRMKTITSPQPGGANAEVLPPEQRDELAASFKAKFGRAA